MQITTIHCSSCGAPLEVPAGASSVRCEYCGTSTQVVRESPDVVPTSGRSPIYFFSGLSTILIGLGAYAAFRSPDRASVSPPLAPSVVAPVPPPAVTPDPPAPAPSPEPAEPSSEQPSTHDTAPGVEHGPLALTWNGRIRSASGAAPRVGSPCTLTARITSDGDHAHQDLLSVQCGGQVLYDSTLPLNGMASTSFGLGEVPLAGEAHAFRYVVKAEDVGTRAGPKSQLSADSQTAVLEVFRDTAPSFRVSASLDHDSQLRRGLPLFNETVPAFDEVVTRKAKVVQRSDSVPFAASICDVRISPAYAKGDTCRITVTCGGRVVYGGGTHGYVQCLVADGRPTSAVDATPTPSSGDPQLQIDLLAGTATLADTLSNGATYSVSFAITKISH